MHAFGPLGVTTPSGLLFIGAFTPSGSIVLGLLQIFADNIAPIMIVSVFGYIIGRRFELDPRQLGKIIYYVFSPALVFRSLSTSEIQGGELGQLVAFMIAFCVGIALLTWIIMTIIRSTRMERACVMLAATCINAGNFGLPLVSFAFGEKELARAVVLYVVATVLNYTLGVFIASSGSLPMREAFFNIARVPVVYASIAGVLVRVFQIPFPPLVDRSVLLMSQASIPCMLILLGLQLARSARISRPRLIMLSSGLRLIGAPLFALLLTGIFGLTGPAFVAGMMQASMPMAVFTLILGTEFEMDENLLLNSILATTLFSPITLSILILWLRAHPM